MRVSQNGGHLASNLGVVELTLALHYVYDFGPYPAGPDRLLFDVGHQSYPHKMLTGRAGQFPKLRKKGIGQRISVAGRIALRPVCRRPRRHGHQHRRRHGHGDQALEPRQPCGRAWSAMRRSSTAWPSKASTPPARSSGKC